MPTPVDIFLHKSTSWGGGGTIWESHGSNFIVDGNDGFEFSALVVETPVEGSTYAQVDAGLGCKLSSVRIFQGTSDVQHATELALSGSEDNVTFTAIDTLTPSVEGEYTKSFTQTDFYRYYRLTMTTMVVDNNGYWRLETFSGFVSSYEEVQPPVAPPVRVLSAGEIEISQASYRRAGSYVEIAKDDPSMTQRTSSANSWPGKKREQSWSGETVGTSGLTQISVCRLGDMREVIAVLSGDGASIGTGDPTIITVRLQSAPEGFSYPHVVFQTADEVHEFQIFSSSNPYLNTGNVLTEDKTLVLVVRHGTEPDTVTTIFVSNNYGQSWHQAWQDTSGHIKHSKLASGPDGKIYMFFEDSIILDLEFYVSTALVSDWDTSFTWDNEGSSTSMWALDNGGTAPSIFDIYHDGELWVYGQAYYQAAPNYTTEFRINSSVDPSAGIWSTHAPSWSPYANSDIAKITVARSGGHNEFGRFPPGTIVYALTFTSGRISYGNIHYDLILDTFTQLYELGWDVAESPQGTGWMDGYYGWYYDADDDGTRPQNRLDNREIWNSILTPSTSIKYHATTWPDPYYVEVDTHGPEDTDEDSVDVFPGFWTKSNESWSAAFPPYSPGMDFEIDFQFETLNRDYHNVWFVVDDPAHPDRPLFKADFYVGRDVVGGTHPHDTARGMAIWFCRNQWEANPLKDNPTGPRGEKAYPYAHPLQMIFHGFDDAADNERIWRFQLYYTYATDTWSLNWVPTADSWSWEPFIPYAADHPTDTREYVDVGTEDDYVASETERYCEQPRGDIWPKRFYFGCPESKPAIQKQSTIRVSFLWTYWATNYDNNYTLSDAPVVLVPRLSGGADMWSLEDDVVCRRSWGHEWEDLYTVTSAHLSQALNSGPDQAEISLFNFDNFHSRLYNSLRHYHVMVFARSGSRTRGTTTPYNEGGQWGRWRTLFAGTSDTGDPVDSDSGPTITMRAFSPLRDMSRSSRTQAFTAIEPPEKKNTDGTGTDTPAVKEMRLWNVIFMLDFTHPADLSMPVDASGKLMRYDDYVARYVWEDLLQNDIATLDYERVGFTPSNLTVNASGKEADLLDDLRVFWQLLGLVCWWDYDNNILRVWKRDSLGLDGDSAITLMARAMVSTPFSGTDTDWQKAGNAIVTTSNMESRPNMSVARVAPWPDGSGAVEQGADSVGGQASQAGTADMYRYHMALNQLITEWASAVSVPIPIAAYPYLNVGMVVDIELEGDQPDSLVTRYHRLEHKYYVQSIETQITPDELTSTVTLVDVVPFRGVPNE
jgi:hypothetical protein